MKNILYLLASGLILMASSCSKFNADKMIVIRDCTGTYLRMDGKDYRVCNLEKVTAFADGAEVDASFKRLGECNGSANDQIVCMMYHEHEGWIEVKQIK